ncbi:hypothetical protein D3C85_1214070 [compost metagenome]
MQQVGLVAEEWADLLEVLAHGGHDAVRGAGFMVGRYARCIEVEAGNLAGHLVDVRSGQFAVGLQGAEQLALRELAHLQGVIEHRAGATQLWRLDAPGDRQYFQVQVAGQALVQAQLFAAEVLACIQCGEVEKAEIDRFLHFIGIGAGEQHPGDVRLDDLESIHRMRIKGRVLQGSYQGLAHGRSFRVWGNSRPPLWPQVGPTQTSRGSC